MKTGKLFIAFSTVTAFEVRCKSAASRACRRATEWQVAEAKFETKKAAPNVLKSFRHLGWSVDQESRVERKTGDFACSFAKSTP